MCELYYMQDFEQKNIKIELKDEASIKEWCEKLNCKEKDLLDAILVIGNSARAVDCYLTMNRKKNGDWEPD